MTFTAYPTTTSTPWTTFEIAVEDGRARVLYTSGPKPAEGIQDQVLSGACYLARTPNAVSATMDCGFIVVAAGRA